MFDCEANGALVYAIDKKMKNRVHLAPRELTWKEGGGRFPFSGFPFYIGEKIYDTTFFKIELLFAFYVVFIQESKVEFKEKRFFQ